MRYIRRLNQASSRTRTVVLLSAEYYEVFAFGGRILLPQIAAVVWMKKKHSSFLADGYRGEGRTAPKSCAGGTTIERVDLIGVRYCDASLDPLRKMQAVLCACSLQAAPAQREPSGEGYPYSNSSSST